MRIAIILSHFRAWHDALRETSQGDQEPALAEPALGSHWFQITVICVKERIEGGDETKKPKGGGEGGGLDRNSVYSHFYTNP